MISRYLAMPFRLMLGLPPLYGITLGNRLLQFGRAIGIYRGRINWRVRVKALRMSVGA